MHQISSYSSFKYHFPFYLNRARAQQKIADVLEVNGYDVDKNHEVSAFVVMLSIVDNSDTEKLFCISEGLLDSSNIIKYLQYIGMLSVAPSGQISGTGR